MLKSELNLKEAMARKASKILIDIKETEEELMVKQLIILGIVITHNNNIIYDVLTIRRKQTKERTREQSVTFQRPVQESKE